MHKERYTEHSVIDRANEIYRIWKKSKYNSRKIVGFVQAAVQRLDQKRTRGACLEALSCLYALDLRVKERYATFLRRVFLYFSWRRETAALKWIMQQLNIPYGSDVRAMIEIELDSILARLGIEIEEDKDEQSKGGKTRLSDEKGVTKSTNEQDGEKLEAGLKTNPLVKKKISKHESGQQIGEDLPLEDEIGEEANVEKSEPGDASLSASADQITVTENELSSSNVSEKQANNFNEIDNNGLKNTTAPISDTAKQTYNNAVDSPPIPAGEEIREDKKSFIDEAIIDGVVLAKNDPSGKSYPEGEKNVAKDGAIQDAPARNPEDGNVAEDKDGHLYDKMVLDSRKANPVAQSEGARESIKVDMQNDKENAARGTVNIVIPENVIKAHKAALEAEMRHQISVQYGDQGVVDPGAKVDPNKSSAPNREVPVIKASEVK